MFLLEQNTQIFLVILALSKHKHCIISDYLKHARTGRGHTHACACSHMCTCTHKHTHTHTQHSCKKMLVLTP
jgi:hypothetical protein